MHPRLRVMSRAATVAPWLSQLPFHKPWLKPPMTHWSCKVHAPRILHVYFPPSGGIHHLPTRRPLPAATPPHRYTAPGLVQQLREGPCHHEWMPSTPPWFHLLAPTTFQHARTLAATPPLLPPPSAHHHQHDHLCRSIAATNPICRPAAGSVQQLRRCPCGRDRPVCPLGFGRPAGCGGTVGSYCCFPGEPLGGIGASRGGVGGEEGREA